MHPDFSLVLQKCASNLSLKHKQPILFSAYVNGKNMSASTAEMSNNSPDDTEDLVRIVSDEEDEVEGEDTAQFPQHNTDQEEEDDNISLCSELSVGKENPGEERPASMDDEEILDISDTHSNSSTEEMQHSPSVSSQETGINPFALANTLRFPVPFGLQPNAAVTAANISPFQEEFLRKSHLYAEELMKHQMQLMAAARASAFSLRSNSLPQLHHSHPINSTPNLVHHLNPLAKIGQLSAAAAAALSAAAQQNHKPLNHGHHPHHMLQQQQQHQHLHHQYSLNNDTLAKLTDLSKQHSPTTIGSNTNTTHHMMSTLNQLQTQMQAHLPGLLHDNNDNLHERALKFSIDNILKADFGRSNSLDSPPQQRKTSQHKSHSHRQKLNTSSSSSSTASTTVLNDSLEHTAQTLAHNISPSTQTFSSSLATICTNSNDSSSTAVSSSYSSANGAADLVKSSPSQTPTLSPGFSATFDNVSSGGNKNVSSSSKNEESSTGTSTSATGTGSGPIVWPAWVYCTRYSDRPSSGKCTNCFSLKSRYEIKHFLNFWIVFVLIPT
ncbi:homeobox protein invected-like [Calliphora vicina]|uniref:homeobox protein invected-like n=1 Tax=Calliphora vicina TaxID=7373 RepID=UPI00325AE847